MTRWQDPVAESTQSTSADCTPTTIHVHPITRLLSRRDRSTVRERPPGPNWGGFIEILRSSILNIQTDLEMRR